MVIFVTFPTIVLLSTPSCGDVECAAFHIIPYLFRRNKFENMHEKLLVDISLLSTFCAFLETNKMIDVANSLCDRSGEDSNFYERSLCTQ